MVVKQFHWINEKLGGIFGDIGVRVETDLKNKMWMMKIEIHQSELIPKNGIYIHEDRLKCVHYISDRNLQKLKTTAEEFILKCKTKYKRGV